MKARVIFWFGLCACFVVIYSLVFASGDQKPLFEFEIRDTRELKGFFSTREDKKIIVDWGDGKSEFFSGEQHEYHKDYKKPVNARVRVYGENEMILAEIRIREKGANIFFDLKDLPVGLTSFYTYCDGEITGNISELPDKLERFVSYGVSGNIITGNIGELPEGLVHFVCYGRNTVTGDVGDLPRGLENFVCVGANTVSGNVADLPRGLHVFACHGNNTIGGNIADLPEGLSRMRLLGYNFVSGDLAELPGGIVSLRLGGFNTVSGYSPGREWAAGMQRISLNLMMGTGISSEEVDNLLKDLANTTWAGEKLIEITNPVSRSSASDGAVERLKEIGVQIGG